jgi:hypothetical protein
MSGTMPSRSKAYQLPVRHRPVCASSRISSIPRSRHFSCKAARYPSGGSITPPELRIGSMMQAARLPTDWASIRSKEKSSCLRQSREPAGVTKSGR